MKQIFLVCLIAISVTSCSLFNGDGDLDLPKTLDCEYSSNISLTNHNANGVDYVAECLVSLTSGTMTIEPGTVIEFQEGTGLVIDGTGILKAEGNSGEPIIMRSSSGNSPSWRGIHINSSQGKNVMDHVEIHNAGDGQTFALFSNVNAAITVSGRFDMTNSLISNSGDVGIYSEENLNQASLEGFQDNIIEDCASYPIYISMDRSHDLDFDSNEYRENGENMVAFHTLEWDRLTKNLTLKALEIPYFIESGIDLYAGLTLESGVDLVMGNNAFIKIDSPENPFLKAQGSQSSHVTIRGKESISGYWQGIYLGITNTQNILEYTDISDGGSTPMSFSTMKANITLGFEGAINLTNVTSARSGSECDVLISTFGGTPIVDNDNSNLMICTD